MFCHEKGGHFQTGEQTWVPLIHRSEGAGMEIWEKYGILYLKFNTWRKVNLDSSFIGPKGGEVLTENKFVFPGR